MSVLHPGVVCLISPLNWFCNTVFVLVYMFTRLSVVVYCLQIRSDLWRNLGDKGAFNILAKLGKRKHLYPHAQSIAIIIIMVNFYHVVS